MIQCPKNLSYQEKLIWLDGHLSGYEKGMNEMEEILKKVLKNG